MPETIALQSVISKTMELSSPAVRLDLVLASELGQAVETMSVISQSLALVSTIDLEAI